MTAEPEALRRRLLANLLRKLNKCLREHALLGANDRVAIAVSGGKDSLTLLEVLHARRGPPPVELFPIHVVDDQAGGCGPAVDLGALRAHVEGRGLALSVVRADPGGRKPGRRNLSPCFHCAWRRRKALFTRAAELGCGKLALGHHADDVAQTTLLNLLFAGELSTMLPRVTFFGGRITLIRPLSYVSEREIARFAKIAGFPAPPPPCEAARDSRRRQVRDWLRQIEASHPKAKRFLWRAVSRPGASAGPGRQELE